MFILHLINLSMRQPNSDFVEKAIAEDWLSGCRVAALDMALSTILRVRNRFSHTFQACELCFQDRHPKLKVFLSQLYLKAMTRSSSWSQKYSTGLQWSMSQLKHMRCPWT